MTCPELEEYDNSHKHKLPDVVIVKKAFPKVRRRQQKRIWKIKRLDMEMHDENNRWNKKSKRNQGDDVDAQKDKDLKDFMNELEEDPEMRQNVMLYKDEVVIDELEKQLAAMTLDEKAKECKSPIEEA